MTKREAENHFEMVRRVALVKTMAVAAKKFRT